MAIRYFVADVDAALDFYVGVLGFEKLEQWGPAIAMVKWEDQVLWLSGPISSAARPMPDGRVPEPGGWNRIVMPVPDVEALAAALKDAGVSFRGEIITGPGGTQLLIQDPDGNPIELFQSR
jgi:catechol 2,3-dioxygenase-like lactoylglutathione lyase family enzyme